MADPKTPDTKKNEPPKMTVAELDTLNRNLLARERGAMTMRLAVVEMLEEAGHPALAIAVSQLKVKLT